MIADLKPYADYKDSGLPWLGSVPEHWQVRRIKTALQEVDRRSSEGLEPLLSLRMQAGLVDHHALGGRPIPPSALIGYKRVRPGEIVMNRMRASLGLFAAATSEGLVSPDYAIFRVVSQVNVGFAVQLFRTPAMAAVFRLESTGLGTGESGFLRLYSDQFGRLAIPIPPVEEQAAIMRFLDWANTRLERTIRAKRKTIALLSEQKRVIVQRLVACGNDPKTSFKPSGIPWLGDIPSHWTTVRLKHTISRIEQGWSPQCDAQPAGENEWGVLKVGCVNKDSFRGTQNKRLPSTLEPDTRLEIVDGDILVSRANTTELLGLAALAESPRKRLILCDKLFRFRARADSFDPKYLVLLLRSNPSRAQIESSTSGASSSMQNIGQGVLKNLWVAVPPVSEQINIAMQIEADTQPLTAAIGRLEREIDLLREYGTRLVTEVVTGALDVRDAAGRLPAEATDEPALEPSDEMDEEDLLSEESAT